MLETRNKWRQCKCGQCFGGLCFATSSSSRTEILEKTLEQLIGVFGADSSWLLAVSRLCCPSKCSNRPPIWAMHRSNLLKRWACLLAGSSEMLTLSRRNRFSAVHGCSLFPQKKVRPKPSTKSHTVCLHVCSSSYHSMSCFFFLK